MNIEINGLEVKICGHCLHYANEVSRLKKIIEQMGDAVLFKKPVVYDPKKHKGIGSGFVK